VRANELGMLLYERRCGLAKILETLVNEGKLREQ
jgi:hypothetical protein